MSFTTLIGAEDVRALQAGGTPPIVLDASFDLSDTQAGERSFREGHLPGARYVHVDRDLSAPKTGRNGRHPLPTREAFAARVGTWGIAPGTQVVAVDRQQGMFAARVWWMLRWLGHEPVAVLDGGVAAWTAAGGALESSLPGTPMPQPPYPLGTSSMQVVDADRLMTLLGRVRLVDARAPERYRGDVETLDAQAGHIPGASNRFFKDNVGADGRFKTREQLRAEWAPLVAGRPAGEVVHHCGSGVTACHNLLAMEYAGYGAGALYAGSWSEWSSDPTRPIAIGG